MYALGALSAELIFAQAVLKEIGLSFKIHARADSSTARASQRNKESAELIFAQAILREMGLSFLIHARADSSTARAVATKQGVS